MSSNKTIAKNTLFLYFRMFFNMGISLYTSRVILKTLGVEDFGIYNLVGGVVVLFSFLNNSMSSATQRYINIETAKKIKARINLVFCTSMNIHIGISIAVLILAETVGLWFLNYKLNIADDRMDAANIVYQMSVITTVIDITRIPYNATILAYEKMSFYAYFGIFETLMKLIIVYMLYMFTGYDHLIVYSILLMLVNFLGNIIVRFYCIKNFTQETNYKLSYDKELTKEIASFSGWNLFGQVANVGSNQGLNMILNIFIGVTVNAAMGIANQVNAAIYNFISNFQVAFNPQIIQSHALGDIDKHRKIVLNTSKYSFFLMSILATPFLLSTDFILHLWLGNIIPDYVISFTRIIILCSLIESLSGPLWMSAHAVGNIKKYQIILSLILLLNIPVAYILLKLGFSPIYVLFGKFCIALLSFVYRLSYVKTKIRINKKDVFIYISNLLPVCLVFVITLYLVNYNIVKTNSFQEFIINTIMLEFFVILFILLLGLKKSEKSLIFSFISSKLKQS